MRVRNNPLTPLAAVAAGLLAGAVGTVCLDAVHYWKYRRAGGTDSPLAWEFAPVQSWETAPAPGQVAKRVLEGFTQRKLPDRSAWLLTIARIAPERGGAELVTAVGPLLGAQIGEFLRLRGRWSSHPKYGRQVEVHSYAPVLPATVAGIQKYLGSG
jgi:hypothetical protein